MQTRQFDFSKPHQPLWENPTSLQNESTPQWTFADLFIRTKTKELIAFSPNEVQTLYLSALERDYEGFDWRNGVYTLRGAREDVLKARQQGMSTLWLALYFLDTVNTPLTQTIIIADNGERAEMLFKICHRFWEHLPRERRPRKKYSSKRELEFMDLDSVIYVGTAGQGTVGRGGTLSNILMSERAWWTNGDEVEAGLMESVPALGNVTRETTANGLNDYFEARQAEHRGESAFHPRFFSWNMTVEYKTEPEQDFKPTEEEAELASVYDLSLPQLRWRRDKVRTLQEKFPQEYPINEAEAFLSSGNPYFDVETLRALNDALQDPAHNPLERLVIPSEDYPRLRNAYAGGSLHFWRLPEDGKTYVIGADTAQGLDPDKGDFDAADVLDADTWEQVATICGKWDTRHYGELLAELGWLYNSALLAIEQNNHGHAVINAAIQLGYPLQRGGGNSGLYMHDARILGDTRHTNPDSRPPGWPETAKSKTFALDKLATALVDSDLVLHDRQTVSELRTFVRKAAGVAGGEGKAHDDRVISLAIGVAMLSIRFRKDRRFDNLTLPEPTVPYSVDRPV